METAPVLLSGDDGVPLRGREELEAVGIPVVAVCSSTTTLAARAAAAAGSRLVIGSPTAPGTWEQAGVEGAQAVGLLSADDLTNLNAALLGGEHADAPRIVVRLFQADLAHGVERMRGGRGTVLSDTDEAAPAFLQAALSATRARAWPSARAPGRRGQPRRSQPRRGAGRRRHPHRRAAPLGPAGPARAGPDRSPGGGQRCAR